MYFFSSLLLLTIVKTLGLIWVLFYCKLQEKIKVGVFSHLKVRSNPLFTACSIVLLLFNQNVLFLVPGVHFLPFCLKFTLHTRLTLQKQRL